MTRARIHEKNAVASPAPSALVVFHIYSFQVLQQKQPAKLKDYCAFKLHNSFTNKRKRRLTTHSRVVICIMLDSPDHEDLPLEFPALGISLVCISSD